MPNPELAGTPYRPANGTEGEAFVVKYCDRCRNQSDGFMCSTGYNAMIPTRSDLTEWTHDEQGRPTCTKFEEM